LLTAKRWKQKLTMKNNLLDRYGLPLNRTKISFHLKLLLFKTELINLKIKQNKNKNSLYDELENKMIAY